MLVQDGSNIVLRDGLDRSNTLHMRGRTEENSIRRRCSRNLGCRTGVNSLGNVKEILQCNRSLCLLVSNSIGDMLRSDHIRFSRDYTRIRYMLVFKTIRVGLNPTIDKIDVMGLVTKCTTRLTYIIRLAMVLERESALDAEMCEEEHSPFLEVVIAWCQLNLATTERLKRGLGLILGL